MRSTFFLAAVAAFTRFTAAQDCDDDIEVENPDQSIDCSTVEGDVTIKASGEVNLSGISKIKGSLIMSNGTANSIRADNLEEITERLSFEDCEGLSSISMPKLRKVKEIDFKKLTSVRNIEIGQVEADKISMIDVYANQIDLDTEELDELTVVEMVRLPALQMRSLKKVGGSIRIYSNGKRSAFIAPKLTKAGDVEIRNVVNVDLDALEEVEKSLKFDECLARNITLRNLTEVGAALSFINNEKLESLDVPMLKSIGGDLRVVNNTELAEIEFDKLETVSSMNIGGNLMGFNMSSIDSLSGASKIATTKEGDEGEEFCEQVNSALEDKSKGKVECTFENENANEGGDSDGGKKGSGSSSDDEEDAAGVLSVNSAMIGLAVLAGIAQLL